VPPEVYGDRSFTDKYSIEQELGVGGAGVVVSAWHLELDERVAIKFLLPGHTNEAVGRFRREARAATRIKNQHVVRINDVSTTPSGVPYIVMEYLDGVDLERLLLQCRDHQLPVAEAVDFVLQACEALAECHGLGIVHRDLKPSNLFCVYGADGLAKIKVLDFGISKLIETSIVGNTTDESRVFGSPRYMSPEQFDNPADVDLRTDIWSIGVILYELITGVAPFVETDMLKLWQKIRSDRPVLITALRADVPTALGPVLLKCLEKDRKHRYANLSELAKALLPFAPERARASVATIVRTVESPGTATSALDLPPPRDRFVGVGARIQSAREHSAPAPKYGVALLVVIAIAVAVAVAQDAHPPAAMPSAATVTAYIEPAIARDETRPGEMSTLIPTPKEHFCEDQPLRAHGTDSEPASPNRLVHSAPLKRAPNTRSNRDAGAPAEAGSIQPAEPLIATVPASAAASANATSLPDWLTAIVEKRKRDQ